MVRLRVAENPSTNSETLQKLALDSQKDVSLAATIKLNERVL